MGNAGKNMRSSACFFRGAFDWRRHPTLFDRGAAGTTRNPFMNNAPTTPTCLPRCPQRSNLDLSLSPRQAFQPSPHDPAESLDKRRSINMLMAIISGMLKRDVDSLTHLLEQTPGGLFGFACHLTHEGQQTRPIREFL